MAAFLEETVAVPVAVGVSAPTAPDNVKPLVKVGLASYVFETDVFKVFGLMMADTVPPVSV